MQFQRIFAITARAATKPEKASELRKQLADWRVSVEAQMPTPNPKPVEPFPPQKPEK